MIPPDLIIFATISGFVSVISIADKIITSAHRHGKFQKILKWKPSKSRVIVNKKIEYKEDIIDLASCIIDLISVNK